VRTILACVGEDPSREGLLGTPERYAKAMLFFTKGYEENVKGGNILQIDPFLLTARCIKWCGIH
jgi:GTP cyclohydrolase I